MKPENSSPKIDYDVAIVGAGPVGLATALGLRQRGIENIIVFDQTRAFRKVGQVIGLYSAFQIDELHRHNQNLVGTLHATSLLWSTDMKTADKNNYSCLLYTSPSPRDKRQSRMPSSA